MWDPPPPITPWVDVVRLAIYISLQVRSSRPRGKQPKLSLGGAQGVNAPTTPLRYPVDPLISHLFATQSGHRIVFGCVLDSRKCEVHRCHLLSHHWYVSQISR